MLTDGAIADRNVPDLNFEIKISISRFFWQVEIFLGFIYRMQESIEQLEQQSEPL